MLLGDPGHESGHVDEGHQRHVEAIAGPDEPRGLDRRVDVERAGEDRRLLRDDPHASPPEPREADQDVRRPARLDLEEVGVIDDPIDDLVHVVWQSRIVGHDPVQLDIHSVDRVRARPASGFGQVVLRQVREDPANRVERRGFVIGREMCDAALRRVGVRAAEVLGIDLLVGDRPSRRSVR